MKPILAECNEVWGKVSLMEELPPLTTREKLVYVPYDPGQPWGIFTHQGAIVQESVDHHGPDANTNDQVMSWDGCATEQAPDATYFYGGVFNPHYGHFIVNTLSRLWLLARTDSLPARLLFHGSGTPEEWFRIPFFRDIMEALSLTPDAVVSFRQPMLLHSLVIPGSSFQEQHHIHRVHAELGHRIGNKILENRTFQDGLPPVYLTKSGLAEGVGRIVNEPELEVELRAAGMEIVHPERLSLREQVAMFVERPFIVGTTGSAFHTSLFQPPRARLVLLSPIPGPNSNFLLIDAANRNDATYLYASDTKVVKDAKRFLTSFHLPQAEAVARELVRIVSGDGPVLERAFERAADASADAVAPAAGMDRVFTLHTVHGTRMAVRDDGTVVQVSQAEAPDAGHHDLLVFRPARDDMVCFLCSDAGSDLSIEGDEFRGRAPSCRVHALDDGRISLQHCSTDKFLCPTSGDGVSSGTVVFVADHPGMWEGLQARSFKGRGIPPILSQLLELDARPGGITSASRITELARAANDPDASLVASLLRLLSPEQVRGIVPGIMRSPLYPHVFPSLRQHLGRQSALLWGGTTDVALRFWIENCGYEVGRHTYGSPTIWSGLLHKDKTHFQIGKYCAIAGNIDVVVANHQTRWASIYPFVIYRDFWPGIDGTYSDHVARPVVVGNDVWIGAHACLLPGTTIGDGAVIAAYAVVRGTVPPYSIVSGNPGRIVGYRFDEGTIRRLLRVRWWDWPDWKVDAHLSLMMSSDLGAFLDAAEGERSPEAPCPSSPAGDHGSATPGIGPEGDGSDTTASARQRHDCLQALQAAVEEIATETEPDYQRLRRTIMIMAQLLGQKD